MEKEFDRVRLSTAQNVNKKIDARIIKNLKKFSGQPKEEITKRIIKLEKEWSIERWLELNASTLAFIGIILGVFVHMYWLFLPAIILPFLALHAVNGWCPPLPVMRFVHVRTRREIDWEKFSLKFMRGDFEELSATESEENIFQAMKKNS
ncbi:MAG: hypothetical protein WD595_06565 [Waddliaceae bacterium]